jgi:hypothetical protein
VGAIVAKFEWSAARFWDGPQMLANRAGRIARLPSHLGRGLLRQGGQLLAVAHDAAAQLVERAVLEENASTPASGS